MNLLFFGWCVITIAYDIAGMSLYLHEGMIVRKKERVFIAAKYKV